MDMMEVRRRVMLSMASGKEELVTIPPNNISNTKDMDAFLETIVTGWNTENILLGYKDGDIATNGMLLCFSKYMVDLNAAFDRVWRSKADGTFQNSVSRNDWVITIKEGSVYRVIRNPFTLITG